MKKSQKGFTIIEVALVLAIGALIFLVVFLAVPALQRNQRNDARKRDVSNLVQAVADYNGNNSQKAFKAQEGVYKVGADGIEKLTGANELGAYIDTLSTNIEQVNTKEYSTGTTLGTPNDGDEGIINIYKGAKCNADGNNIESAAGRMAAVVGVMENANGFTYYCQDAS